MTVASRRARKAERAARHGRSSDLDTEDRVLARETIRGLFGSAVDTFDLGLLDGAESRELVEFCRRVRFSTKVEGAGVPVSPAAAESFAAAALALAEREVSGRPLQPYLRRNAEMAAEFARERGRKPTRPEFDVITANRDPAATLSALRLPPPPSGEAGRGFDLGKLDAEQRARFESLIELACGAEAGDIFEKARAEGRLTAQLHALYAKVAPGPRVRKRVDSPGQVSLPKEVLDDLLATGGDAVALNLAALAVLTFVCLCIENRRLPAGTEAVARLVDDDRVIEVRRGCSPLGATGTGGGEEISFARALADACRMQWLTVERAGGWDRVSYGPAMLRHLQAREEVPS